MGCPCWCGKQEICCASRELGVPCPPAIVANVADWRFAGHCLMASILEGCLDPLHGRGSRAISAPPLPAVALCRRTQSNRVARGPCGSVVDLMVSGQDAQSLALLDDLEFRIEGAG